MTRKPRRWRKKSDSRRTSSHRRLKRRKSRKGPTGSKRLHRGSPLFHSHHRRRKRRKPPSLLQKSLKFRFLNSRSPNRKFRNPRKSLNQNLNPRTDSHR